MADPLDRRLTAGQSLYLVTFTAPGDGPHRRLNFHGTWHPGMHRPDCDCWQSLGGDLGVWNAGASRRWNHLRTSLARDFDGFEFFRAVEVQEGVHKAAGAGRMALHLHVVAALDGPMTAEDRDRLQARALAAGFGCSVDVQPITGGDLSRYVTKAVSGYVTKASDARAHVPWVDPASGELVDEPRYRVWSASRGWGLTMRSIREAVRAAAQRQAQRYAELAGPVEVSPTWVLPPEPPPAPPDPALLAARSRLHVAGVRRFTP